MGRPVPIISAIDDMERTKEYPLRKTIKRIYVHHSGRAGRAGLQGAKNSARYVVNNRKFPGPAYHYWIPFKGTAIYQTNHENRRCWHTGGRANAHGIGVCLQGNTSLKPMSAFQGKALKHLLDKLCRDHWLTVNPVSWHSASGKYGGKSKKACPGSHATAWLEGWSAQITYT